MMNNDGKKKKFPWIMALVLVVILGAFAVGILGNDLGENTPDQGEKPAEAQNVSGLFAVLSGPILVEACQEIPVEFTITNQGDEGIYLLTWYTPLEGVAGRIFQVTFQGQELDYQGILAMRGNPTRDQYILLEAGESASAEVDLNQVFDFSRPGEYQISYLSPWISFAGEDPDALPENVEDLGPVKINSEPITLEILPARDGESCGSPGKEGSFSPAGEPEIVLTGVVRDISPSLMMIWLAEGTEEIQTIALQADTILTGIERQRIDLIEIEPGMEIMAAGQPGEAGVLIANEVRVLKENDSSPGRGS